SKLDWSERERNSALCELHRDLIRLRKDDTRLRQQIPGAVDGAVLGADCFALRFFSQTNDERLLIVNLGSRFTASPLPEPLLAPPADHIWETIWTSESPRYGGIGAVEMNLDVEWTLPAEAALLFKPRKRTRSRKKPVNR
ncbi:MAG: DUF3459 domain-containing protein, partial [Chthoniobacterales bacterium]|nr:DUF3459 domain-containing protein [Chthoniobacterales bacterium]